VELSRRELSLAGLSIAAASATGGLLASASGCSASPAADDSNFSLYDSTLINGLTPEFITWAGRKWHCAAGSTWHPGMDHCVRLKGDKARFELRNTEFDRPNGDPVQKRRSELHFPRPPRLPNEIPLWGAVSFIHHRWSDPLGMVKLMGGALGQIHMGSSFGGSPAVAFRRENTGAFAVTTSGEVGGRNVKRYEATLAFDRPHDVVYRVVLSPTQGSLVVWLNREKIVDLEGASIGSHFAESYWNLGCYFAGGVSCPVVAEFANLAYPSPDSLQGRTISTPSWPAG